MPLPNHQDSEDTQVSGADSRHARRIKAEKQAMLNRGNAKYLRDMENLQVAMAMHRRGFDPEEIEVSTGIPLERLEDTG
jgi:hypothetical protein